jgi:manganese transport protein
VQAELIAVATDLAEFLGAALGFHLLFGIGLLPAAFITGVAAFLILGLQHWGVRPLEAAIGVIVLAIGLSYVVEIFKAHPDWGAVGRHAFVPEFQGRGSVLLAVGILGATVMPHVIWLHSALTQGRILPPDEQQTRRLMRLTLVDVLIAMAIAGLINIAMLVMAASTFYRAGLHHVASLEGAHTTLTPLLGSAASALFALALLLSGLSSSAVGTLAGQVVMQGFIRRRIPLAVRRVVTMLPAFVVIAAGADPSRTLVLSQVILSFGIPFALIPLVWFTSRKRVMGQLTNRPATTAAATLIAALIVSLNVFLLATQAGA